MQPGAITSYVDVAQLVLYAFWLFFAGVIWYLVRENRREGYPLETHRGTRHTGWIDIPSPKKYLLEDGRTIESPRTQELAQVYSGERGYENEGAPIEPVGPALLAGVGPGAWAPRPEHPDRDAHGTPKIRPLSAVPECGVSEHDPDPRGMTVLDADGNSVGTVRELWLDAPEMVFRYLEVDIGSRTALVPMTFCRITRDSVKVHALLAHQWMDVPALRAAGEITLDEEERIAAYFGGGLLYATAERQEPLL
jgi:photosynthetic reaction center H subunit